MTFKKKATMGVGVRARCQLHVCNARTGKVERKTPWFRNMLLDQGLNGLAQSSTNSIQTYPAACFTSARIGDSTDANSFASGAITFTQAGTTLTASGNFFTAAMAGGIFKWGTGSGGTENYIASFTSATEVELQDSETVGTPEVGTVWMVQRTNLVNQIAVATGYQTNSGDNQTTIVGNVVTLKRTFTFAVPGAPQNVNEIGYYKDGVTARCYGRIVLPATVVVGTSNFLVLVLELELTYEPGTPTAVADVGTNISTAGNAILESLVDSDAGRGVLVPVASTGGVGANSACFDGSGNNGAFKLITQDYTQRASTNSGGMPSFTRVSAIPSLGWTYASQRGLMRMSQSGAILACSGQTLYGIGLGGFSSGAQDDLFDIKLTATDTLPTGNFTYNMTFDCLYGRILTNV